MNDIFTLKANGEKYYLNHSSGLNKVYKYQWKQYYIKDPDFGEFIDVIYRKGCEHDPNNNNTGTDEDYRSRVEVFCGNLVQLINDSVTTEHLIFYRENETPDGVTIDTMVGSEYMTSFTPWAEVFSDKTYNVTSDGFLEDSIKEDETYISNLATLAVMSHLLHQDDFHGENWGLDVDHANALLLDFGGCLRSLRFSNPDLTFNQDKEVINCHELFDLKFIECQDYPLPIKFQECPEIKEAMKAIVENLASNSEQIKKLADHWFVNYPAQKNILLAEISNGIEYLKMVMGLKPIPDKSNYPIYTLYTPKDDNPASTSITAYNNFFKELSEKRKTTGFDQKIYNKEDIYTATEETTQPNKRLKKD